MDMRHYKEWVKIGLNILYYRKERHLTQQQLAEQAEGLTYIPKYKKCNSVSEEETEVG